jgi:type I restriction enzyme M protein
MALKKSELYSSLWSSCDELRGGMDAGQYKDYVLVLLFVKYVSDKYAGQPYAPIKMHVIYFGVDPITTVEFGTNPSGSTRLILPLSFFNIITGLSNQYCQRRWPAHSS